MLQILTVIAPLFLLIFASAFLQKVKNIGDDWSKVLNDYSLKFGLPVLIFAALSKAPFSFSEQAQLIGTNSVFILGCFGLAFLVGKMLRLDKQMFRTLFICFVFGNVAYLGIPVLTQVFGEEILPTASLIVAIYLFWLFTVGISTLDYSIEKSKKIVLQKMVMNLLKNPLLIAVVLGIMVGSAAITLPDILLKTLDMITASVTPTVLIVIGLFIGKSTWGEWREWIPVILFTILTLILLPAIFYYGAKTLGYDPIDFSSSIIQAAMPLAITPFALADKYNLNRNFIARSIVLSTIFSVVTLPLWISFLSR